MTSNIYGLAVGLVILLSTVAMDQVHGLRWAVMTTMILTTVAVFSFAAGARPGERVPDEW